MKLELKYVCQCNIMLYKLQNTEEALQNKI